MGAIRRQLRSLESAIDNSLGRKRLGYLLAGLILLFLVLFPLMPDQSNYSKTIFISGFFYAILASSWALLAGIAGQFSFAHMAFMGIGAYTAGLLGQYGVQVAALGLNIPPESIPPPVAITAGVLMAGLIGLVIGALCLRLRAAYLALFTIAFSEMLRIVLLTEFDITGGNNGLSLRRLVDLGDVTATRNVNYYIMLGLMLASLVGMYALVNSRIGLFMRSMREDEEAASALGVDVVRYKVFVFVITSMIVGLAGGVYYHNVGAERITPETMEILQMSLVIAYAVIGGMESLVAAGAGAFLSLYVLESIREVNIFGFSFEPGAWRYALFGLVLMLTLRFARNGLLYPIVQWFSNADAAREETVSIRKQSNTDAVSSTTDAQEATL